MYECKNESSEKNKQKKQQQPQTGRLQNLSFFGSNKQKYMSQLKTKEPI